jgi:hypothetical protein
MYTSLLTSNSVTQWGPLWSTSAFLFEDANGKLKKFFHGTSGITNQIFSSFTGASFLRDLANRYILQEQCSPMIFNKIVSLTSMCKGLEIGNNTKCLGSGTQKLLTAAEVLCVQMFSKEIQLLSNRAIAYTRVIINGLLLHTEEYSKGIKCRDCCISVKKKKSSFWIVGFVIIDMRPVGNTTSLANLEKILLIICHPIVESTVNVDDKDIGDNILNYVRKATIDRNNLIAFRGEDITSKLYMVSDASGQQFVVPVPQFELD